MRKILLGIVVLLLITSVSYCQESNQSLQRFDKNSPLVLTIKSDKQVYELDDDIILTLTMKNIGEDEIYVPYFEILNNSFLVINGKEIAFSAPAVGGQIEGYLLPGAEFPYRVHIKGMYGTDKVGEYSLFWRYKNLTSNTITIEVKGKKVSEVLPHMEKGWELYSWKVDNEWHFTLIPGTNRNKTYEEIILAKYNPGHTVKGIGSIKALLKRLPKGEGVFWVTKKWSGITTDVKAQLRKNNIALIYPTEEIITEIRNYCKQLGVKLGGLSK